MNGKYTDILIPGALIPCVTLFKSLSLSGPQCPIHKMGLYILVCYPPEALGGSEGRMEAKVFCFFIT